MIHYNVKDHIMSYSQDYIDFCRPYLGKLLKAIRMDVDFYRGDSNNLFYKKNTGNDVKVLDLLGGFGTGLFGHHHPRLTQVLSGCLIKKTPFNTQGSCRTKSAVLTKKLSQIMFDSFGHNYITTLTNTGTETVEAAIKHSLRSFGVKTKLKRNDFQKRIILLKRAVKAEKLIVSNNTLDALSTQLRSTYTLTLKELFEFVENSQKTAFSKKPVFFSLKKAFHGQTCGSVQLTHYQDYREYYEHLGPETIFIDPDSASLKQAIESTTITYWNLKRSRGKLILNSEKHYPISALFVEPVQGEGGVHPLSDKFLISCRKLADKFKFPLVFDEIQTGMGRTGSFFNCIKRNIKPDYCLVAKSLGGGLVKIGAMLVEESLYNDEFGYLHNSTFVEDDLSSAVAIEAIDLLFGKENLMNRCTKMGQFLLDGITEIQKKYPGVIREVRGAGLMIGIEFMRLDNSPSRALRSLSRQNLLVFVITGYFLKEHNIRVAPTMSDHCTMRLLPSALIAEKDCLRFITALGKLCEIIKKQNLYRLTRYIVDQEMPGDKTIINDYSNTKDPAGVILNDTNITKVSFVNHFIQAEDIKLWDEGFSEFSNESMKKFLLNTWEIMQPCFYDEFLVKSITGAEIIFKYIAISVSSEIFNEKMLNLDIDHIRDLIEKGFDLAVEDGCTMVGFGGYTSILTRNCKTIISEKSGATTGNALTVSMGLEALEHEAKLKEIIIENSCFAAVGAAGNIGSIYCELMADSVPEILLITRPGGEEKLFPVAEKIYFQAISHIWEKNSPVSGIASVIKDSISVKNFITGNKDPEEIGYELRTLLENELGDNIPVKIGSDLGLLKNADLILGASNSSDSLIFPEMLSDRPIVICDISVPMDTDQSVIDSRPDIDVIQGGIAKLPLNPEFKVKGIRLDYSQAFSCMAESMILGLEGIKENFSYGEITRELVKEAGRLAKKHGFTLARSKKEKSM